MDPAVSIPNVETNEFRYPICISIVKRGARHGRSGSSRGRRRLAPRPLRPTTL